jgi:hypothetical protein
MNRPFNHREPHTPVGSQNAPASPSPVGVGATPRNPDCIKCGRGYWVCICGCPEPEPEYFRPALNRDPDLHTQAMQSEVRL